MRTHAPKKQKGKSLLTVNSVAQKQDKESTTSPYVDHRPEAITQRKLQESIHNSPRTEQASQLQKMANQHVKQNAPIQKKENNTGLPHQLKSGIENLSGYSMDDVKVHYNSSKPAQLKAHAYAQGSNIHIAPGQEKHLPHEAWHVVQQKQGRVKPTLQMKSGVNINDDSGLEREADVMGAKALNHHDPTQLKTKKKSSSTSIVQRGRIEDEENETGVEKYVIKAVLPGSGDDNWRPNKDDPTKKGIRFDDPTNTETPTTHVKKTAGKKFTWTVSGPGAPLTKGGSMFGGASDTGSNSIVNNKTVVPAYILANIEAYEQQYGVHAKPILILIKAHSRNAVAGTQIANMVRQATKYKPNIKIELVAFDPVPGPDHKGTDVEVDVSSIPNSTVIYSVATQYPAGFTPQKVLGAKRIIISRQDHSVGLVAGFRYDNKIYKGSRINSLPEGVFVDSNKTGENTQSLLKVDTMRDAIENLENEFQNSESKTRDYGRLEIIGHVLHDYFRRRRPIKIPNRVKIQNPKTGASYSKSKTD